MPQIDHRMTELEIRYTHLVRLIDELNEVVTECNQRISQLEKDNGRLQEMLRSFAPEMSESPDE